jgi:transposase
MTVNIDYCVNINFHNYSVPYQFAGEKVDARTSGMTVEIFRKGKRIASHVRGFRRAGFTIAPEHMPKSHQQHLKWTPSRLIHWGDTIGANTSKLIEAILNDRPHPEQGYRSCLGIFRLGQKYGEQRLENACARALRAGARSYKHIESILKNGLDKIDYAQQQAQPKQMYLVHDNVRGPEYYSQTKGESER